MKPIRQVLLAATACLFATAAYAANLVPNGSFSLGNTQFGSDYVFSPFPPAAPPCGNGAENQYTVGTDPRLWNCSTLVISVGDHTTGTGDMLMANGKDTALRVWFTTTPITVTPNTTYFFEAWILNWSSTSVGPDAARLTFRANGADLLTASASGVGIWTPVSAMWNSGASTTVSLELFNNTPTTVGNDFSVDDISLDTTSSICPIDDVIQEVVVNTSVTVDFNPAGNPVCVAGTLCGFFDVTASLATKTSHPTMPDKWKAIFDLGNEKLHVLSGGTITTAQVPATGNNRFAPGIEIRSSCCLTVDGGGAIVVTSVNKPAGDILISVDGTIEINGTVLNAVDGTNGTPGDIMVKSCCGKIATGPASLIQTIGQDAGGSDITIATCCSEGSIEINGLVDASYKAKPASTINIVSFNAVEIDGRNPIGTEAGTKRPITSGVTVRSRRDPVAGFINIQANGDITVHGNTILDPLHPNFGAVAIKPQSVNGSSGAGAMQVVSVGGGIIAFDRAFDFAARFDRLNSITLLAKNNIALSAVGPQAVVSTQGGPGGQGGTNFLRSFGGDVVISPTAGVLADFTSGPGSVGTNTIFSCSAAPPPGQNIRPLAGGSSSVCLPPTPPPLFVGCSDIGLIPFKDFKAVPRGSHD